MLDFMLNLASLHSDGISFVASSVFRTPNTLNLELIQSPSTVATRRQNRATGSPHPSIAFTHAEMTYVFKTGGFLPIGAFST